MAHIRTKSQAGRMSKEKGKRGEREVAALLRSYEFAARRGQQFSGGDDAPDVKHNIPGLHIEVKYVEKFKLWDAMAQAHEDASPSAIPVVFHRKSRKPWLVILSAEDFLTLMKERGQ